MKNNLLNYHTVYSLAKEYSALAQFDVNLADSLDGDIAVSKQLQVDYIVPQKYFNNSSRNTIFNKIQYRFVEFEKWKWLLVVIDKINPSNNIPFGLLYFIFYFFHSAFNIL